MLAIRLSSYSLKTLCTKILGIIIISLCSTTMLITMKFRLYVLWDRILPPFNPQLSIEQDLFIWNFHDVRGGYFVYLTHLPYHILVYAFSMIAPVGVANTVVFWLLFLSAGLSMYIFVLRTLKLDEKVKSYIALIASLSYMFNPFVVFGISGHPLLLFIMAFLPFLMVTMREALISSNTSIKRSFKYLILASLITIFMAPAYIHAELIAIFFAITYVIFLSFMFKLNFRSLAITLITFVIFFLLTNIWWIIPNFMHHSIQAALRRSPQYVVPSLSSLRHHSPFMTYFNVLRGMAYRYTGWKPELLFPGVLVYNSKVFVIISLFIPLIAWSSIISTRIRKYSDSLPLALALVIFIPLFLTGLNPPLGYLIKLMVENLPFYVFRHSSAYMFVVSFVYSYMFALGIFALYHLTSRIQKMRSIRLCGYGVIACLLILKIVINAFPQWLGHAPNVQVLLYDERGKVQLVSALVQIPSYVDEVIDYLNNVHEKGSVLVLPITSRSRGYNWTSGFFGYDIYYCALKRSVLTSYCWGTSPLDKTIEFLNRLILQDDPQLDGSTFVSILTHLNIRYIIVAEDALFQSPRTEINITRIHRFLSKIPEIQFVKRFGKHVLYKITRTSSMFYAIPQSALSEVFNNTSYMNEVILPKRFSSKEISEKLLFQNTEISPTEIPAVSQHHVNSLTINITEINPTSFYLQIFNATTPFILVSCIPYDDNWVADIEGKQLDPIKISFFPHEWFIGWFVNRTGDFEIKVYYRPQRSVKLLFYVSGTFIIMSLMATLLCTLRRSTHKIHIPY